MGKLRQQMYHDLELGNYAESTRRVYLSAVAALARHYHRSPAELGRDEVRAYVRHLAEVRRPSAPRLRQHLSALKFLYEKTLGRPEVVSFLTWPSDAKRLPTVISASEVALLLEAIEVPTYRMVVATVYATGLRIHEVCHLETRDIDAGRGVIHVRQGKRSKERLVPLSPRLLEMLRAYWKVTRPAPPYLFTRRLTRGPVCPQGVRRALHAATKKVAIEKRVTPHVVRHSFATHLLEEGTDLRIIQALLGHASIRSTMRYTHVSAETVARVSSPFDQLPTLRMP